MQELYVVVARSDQPFSSPAVRMSGGTGLAGAPCRGCQIRSALQQLRITRVPPQTAGGVQYQPPHIRHKKRLSPLLLLVNKPAPKATDGGAADT